MVTVAGDVENLGLGKLFWLRDDEKIYLSVLSDTGGAFQPNLHQLDWFLGVVKDKATLKTRTQKLPSHVNAGIIIAR